MKEEKEKVVSVDAGMNHSVCLTSSGRMFCWG
jgi:alpha-tubulin suppressor-like RCC1 family protein